MSFKKYSIGDKVIFINDTREGIVIGHKNHETLIIQCQDIDFEVKYSDIIKVTDETNSFYRAIKNLKNSIKVNEENRKKPNQKSKVLNYKVRLSTDFEVDLHIEKIIDKFTDLSSNEIIDIQMDLFYKAIFEAHRLKLPFIIIIHGLGKGVLKSKIINYLRENNASFCDESPIIYKGGATRINLF